METTQTNIEKKYLKSLKEYYNLASEIDHFTDNYWDMMINDMQGYSIVFYTCNKEEELKEMQKTIKAYKHLLKSLQLVKLNGSRYN